MVQTPTSQTTTPVDCIVPVILSGGTGTRLWPLSRESHPKPFILLPDGQSLLQKTFLRACQFEQAAEIITITNKEYYLKSKAAYAKIVESSLPPKQSYLLEPTGRNTAPAILLACLKVAETINPDAILLVLPADHLISDTNTFKHCGEAAFSLAKANKIVTFGIQPTMPETGYGYIAYQLPRPKFIEKPDREHAESYVQSGQYLWNAGIFCFKASVMLEEFATHAPDLLAQAKTCWQATKHNMTLDESFASLPSISIDYAIMEKSDRIAVIKCDFDWQDVGCFNAYKNLFTSDSKGNAVAGDAILIDSANNFIHSEGRMIASIGIQNLAIIDTPDALLITQRDRTQEVKHVVETLKNRAHESYLTHRTVIRPWGSYTVLEEGLGFKIKRIVVNPHASLSLQKHDHRSEHWVVVEGTAKTVNGDQEQLLTMNQSTFVAMGTQHRLSNPMDTNLIIIEVQTGNYLGEDDITRLEDTYGRISV